MGLVHRVFVTVDCDDPAPVAEFWAALLGGEVAFTTEQAAAVRSEHLWLAAMRTDGHRPPTWPDPAVPKQLHLDLGVDDLDAAEAEARRLGARPADHQPDPGRRRILLDPAGHPFCLTTGIPRSAGAGGSGA